MGPKSAPATEAGQPAKLPTCIPVRYTTREGRYRLAYPRSAWDARLYQVVDISSHSTDTDTLCTVDDFGALVPTHRRNPASAYGMGFMRAAA